MGFHDIHGIHKENFQLSPINDMKDYYLGSMSFDSLFCDRPFLEMASSSQILTNEEVKNRIIEATRLINLQNEARAQIIEKLAEKKVTFAEIQNMRRQKTSFDLNVKNLKRETESIKNDIKSMENILDSISNEDYIFPLYVIMLQAMADRVKQSPWTPIQGSYSGRKNSIERENCVYEKRKRNRIKPLSRMRNVEHKNGNKKPRKHHGDSTKGMDPKFRETRNMLGSTTTRVVNMPRKSKGTLIVTSS
ncbi:hypothetical protein RND71_042533 [Anisodus tanguticus]|uniref:Uncharacterized protein n=1 Tax=Anisodus tanguticus TaxID=243964 RepID=A0AAE1QQX7_9SOLA|nr:hypothetical protein RND71_042533 [Anisodus tanguticus]